LSIAKYYTDGRGVTPNRLTALHYYKIAVENWGDEYASNKIADWHGKGKVKKDIRIALRYTNRPEILETFWTPVWTEGEHHCFPYLVR
jgi:TPR repeat protein